MTASIDYAKIDGRETNPRATVNLEFAENGTQRIFTYSLVNPKSREALLNKLFWLARVNIEATIKPIHNI